jgi:peptidoglycan/LPS O-acetylase OafA/YrhL
LAILRPFLAFGWATVPLFFVLSGYVLSYNYAPGFRHVTLAGYTKFLRRRWLRIYPVHLLTLLAVLAMVLAGRSSGLMNDQQGRFTTRDFALNLFLVQTWVPRHELSWNGPSWSVSSELFAYLLFPLACPLLCRLRGKGLAEALVFLGMASCVAFYTAPQDQPFRSLLAVVPTFATGCLVWAFVRVGAPAPRYLPDVLMLLIAAVTFLPEEPRRLTGPLVIFFVLLVCALAVLGDRCPRWWRARPLLYLGEVSYSLYLTHGLVLTLGSKVLPAARFADSGPGARLAVVAAYGAAFAAAALASYYLVERPCLAAGRRGRAPGVRAGKLPILDEALVPASN